MLRAYRVGFLLSVKEAGNAALRFVRMCRHLSGRISVVRIHHYILSGFRYTRPGHPGGAAVAHLSGAGWLYGCTVEKRAQRLLRLLRMRECAGAAEKGIEAFGRNQWQSG